MRTALQELIVRAMRSLRSHGEFELASALADEALILNREQPVSPQSSGMPTLATIPTLDLLSEFQRRHPSNAIAFEHNVEGQPGQTQVRTMGSTSAVVTLGLFCWGVTVTEQSMFGNVRQAPPGGLDAAGNRA